MIWSVLGLLRLANHTLRYVRIRLGELGRGGGGEVSRSWMAIIGVSVEGWRSSQSERKWKREKFHTTQLYKWSLTNATTKNNGPLWKNNRS